jgi:hypothetical protein
MIENADVSDLSQGQAPLDAFSSTELSQTRNHGVPVGLCLPRISFEQQSLILPGAVVNLAALC